MKLPSMSATSSSPLRTIGVASRKTGEVMSGIEGE